MVLCSLQVLCNIHVFAKAMPSLFAPHYEDFFICSSDSYQIKALKLEILSCIATDSSVPFILKEFQVSHLKIQFFFVSYEIFHSLLKRSMLQDFNYRL